MALLGRHIDISIDSAELKLDIINGQFLTKTRCKQNMDNLPVLVSVEWKVQTVTVNTYYVGIVPTTAVRVWRKLES